MPTPRKTLNPLNHLLIPTLGLVWALVGMPQEEEIHLNTSLDVDTLFQPIVSLEVHGETAVSLLEELETKHYRAVKVDDNFSSAIFDSLIDTLDGSHSYFLRSDIDELSKFRYTLDNSLKSGSVEPEDVAKVILNIINLRKGTIIDEVNLSPASKSLLFT